MRPTRLVLACLIATVLFAGGSCAPRGGGGEAGANRAPARGTEAPDAPAGQGGAAAPAPLTVSPEIARASNTFALDIYDAMRQQSRGNMFFSPLSVSIALAMVHAGARTETAAEIARVLHLPADASSAVDDAYGALLQTLNRAGEAGDYRLSVANALYGQEDHRFLDAYLQLLEDRYAAPLRRVDFAGATEQARSTINEWVEDQTEDRIKDLLAPGSIDASARLVLVNAIYFKGDWTRPFAKDATRDEPFHAAGGRDAAAPLMRQKSTFAYAEAVAEDAGGRLPVQLVELPYKGDDLSMVIVLPGPVDGLERLESDLDWDALAGWVGQLRPQEVEVLLPRFRMTSEFQLGRTLSGMGMPSAFDPQRADFSGIDGERDLFIHSAVHKAFVDVNEEGTEAAAATGITMTTSTAMPRDIVFRADRPFLFLIRDVRSGAVLFLGRMVEPPPAG